MTKEEFESLKVGDRIKLIRGIFKTYILKVNEVKECEITAVFEEKPPTISYIQEYDACYYLENKVKFNKVVGNKDKFELVTDDSEILAS